MSLDTFASLGDEANSWGPILKDHEYVLAGIVIARWGQGTDASRLVTLGSDNRQVRVGFSCGDLRRHVARWTRNGSTSHYELFGLGFVDASWAAGGRPLAERRRATYSSRHSAGIRHSRPSGIDVEKHLDQLAPFLRANSPLIHVLESGLVGAFGEGYYTKNFGDSGVVNDQNWKDRKRVVDKILAVLPANRMTQPSPADPSAARVGLHNDCFLGSCLATHNDPDRVTRDVAEP